MTRVEFDKRLKSKKIDNIYLLYGEEEYLKQAYVQDIKKAVLTTGLEGFNYHAFDTDSLDVLLITEAIESLPVMSDKKLVLFNNIGVTKSKLAAQVKDYLLSIADNPPEYCVIVFKDTEVDKRAKLFKAIDKAGCAVEIDYISREGMKKWIAKELSKSGKSITDEAAEELMDRCPPSMNAVMGEINKLISYTRDIELVEKRHIEAAVSQTLENRVFQLSDAIIEGRQSEALIILEDLKLFKYQFPAAVVYSLIAKHFAGLHAAWVNSKAGIDSISTSKQLGVPPFVVTKYINQAKNMNINMLEDIISRTAKTDMLIKSGRAEGYTEIERLIVNLYN